MSITLASVFDDRSEALRARDRLIEAGIDGAHVRLEDDHEERESSARHATPAEAQPPRRGFLAELFGLGDADARDSADHYAEAVRRGSTVLAVTLPDEARVAEVSEVLEGGRVRVHRRLVERPVEQQVRPREEHAALRRSDVEAGSADTPAAAARDVYSGRERRVANDASYRGPERRRRLPMQ